MKSYVYKEFLHTPYQFAIVNFLNNELIAQAKTPLMAGALLDLCMDAYRDDDDFLCVIDKLHPEHTMMTLEEIALRYDCSEVRMLNIADNRRKAGFQVIRERRA